MTILGGERDIQCQVEDNRDALTGQSRNHTDKDSESESTVKSGFGFSIYSEQKKTPTFNQSTLTNEIQKICSQIGCLPVDTEKLERKQIVHLYCPCICVYVQK